MRSAGDGLNSDGDAAPGFRWRLQTEDGDVVVPAGYRPSTDEAEDRVRHLRRYGPTPVSFTFRTPFPSPSELDAEGHVGDDWHCPA